MACRARVTSAFGPSRPWRKGMMEEIGDGLGGLVDIDRHPRDEMGPGPRLQHLRTESHDLDRRLRDPRLPLLESDGDADPPRSCLGELVKRQRGSRQMTPLGTSLAAAASAWWG